MIRAPRRKPGGSQEWLPHEVEAAAPAALPGRLDMFAQGRNIFFTWKTTIRPGGPGSRCPRQARPETSRAYYQVGGGG